MTDSPPFRLAAEWEPPTPQLIRAARMMIIGYPADPKGLAAVLPPGLKPHRNHRVQMNMYEVGEGQTSGFGPFSLTYLTVEIADHDSELAEGIARIPGRYFAFYWNSSPRVRHFVRGALGVGAAPGERRLEGSAECQTSILKTGGRDVITATVATSDRAAGTLGGHLNYYSRRTVLRPDGGGPALDELLEFPLPFVADVFEASVKDIRFDFPDGHPASLLKPAGGLGGAEVLYADVTFTYSMGRTLARFGD